MTGLFSLDDWQIVAMTLCLLIVGAVFLLAALWVWDCIEEHLSLRRRSGRRWGEAWFTPGEPLLRQMECAACRAGQFEGHDCQVCDGKGFVRVYTDQDLKKVRSR